jgi:hypothetical protein
MEIWFIIISLLHIHILLDHFMLIPSKQNLCVITQEVQVYGTRILRV